MNRIKIAFSFGCLLLAASCEDDPNGPQDIAIEITAMLQTGQIVQAEELCREAIGSDPSNPTLRTLSGDINLAAENGRIAEIDFRKAIALGADVAKMQTRLARALLLQNKFLEVLALDEPASVLDESAQIEMAVIRLRAELNLPGGDETKLRRNSEEIITTLDMKGATEPWVVSLRVEMESLRDSNPLVAAAFEHARCRRPPVEDYYTTIAADSIETERAIIRVGPTRSIKTPAEAATIAVDGTTIAIDAGEYPGGVAYWPQNKLTILGVGGRPHIKAAGRAVQERDIWLFTGDDIVVENMEFSGARSIQYRNGAGIRHTGDGLVVRHSYFHDSDNGILTWKSSDGEITIEFSEFARNGFGDGLSHNIYIGATERLTFRYNYSHAAKEGHLLKSRARINDIRYNRLTGEEGETSYIIDIPNGGVAYVVGNVIEKAVLSKNLYVIGFGEEGLITEENRLFVVNNSVYNRYEKSILIRNASDIPAVIANNLLGGATSGMASGNYTADGNRAFPDHGMINPREYDFELQDTASAIDTGIELGHIFSELPLFPEAEYVHPVSMRPRSIVARLDVGAHEFCSENEAI
jgi:hypothetical protein